MEPGRPRDAWDAAHAEHDSVVARFRDRVTSFPPDRWHQRPAPGRWSAAELALHVCDSYAYGVAAATGGRGMRLRVPRLVAWVSRTVLLPRMLAAERFPRGARAPEEVVPDAADALALSPREAGLRLSRCAQEAVDGLRAAAERTPARRITHAYFGALTPLLALRLLSAHTRHHADGIAAR